MSNCIIDFYERFLEPTSDIRIRDIAKNCKIPPYLPYNQEIKIFYENKIQLDFS